MKNKLARLLALAMAVVLSCMPVLAAPAAAAADSGSMAVQAVKSGWVREGSYYKYYVNGKYYKSGVYKIDGKLYGFSAKGNLCCKWFTIDGNTYYGSTKQGAKGIGVGRVLTGYWKIGGDYYYLNPSKKGARATGFLKINGELLYFDASTGKQRREKGWFRVGNYMYYVMSDGAIATNTTIDGYKIGEDGAVADISGTDKKAQGYSSRTRYLVLVNKGDHKVNIYQGSKGSWVNIRRDMPCTVGRRSAPTPSGRFIIDRKKNTKYGYKDFINSTVFYTSHLSSGNYFHSILYRLGCRNPYTHSPKDASMGKNKSKSCVRLRLEDAKYIYQSIPKNTAAVVY